MSITYFRNLYQAKLISNGNREMRFAEPLNNVNGHFCAVFNSVFKGSKVLDARFLVPAQICIRHELQTVKYLGRI